MGRRIAYLHIGLPGSGGDFLEQELAEHAEALADQGVQAPAVAPGEMSRAAIEIRREHRAWGYERREVEGAWAAICRRVRKGPRVSVVSNELLSACTEDQAVLLLDTLAGIEVHVVITARRADAARHELVALQARVAQALRRPERVHVLVVPADAEPRAWIWQALGDLVGYDVARLREPALSGAARRPRRQRAM
ncbi:hypothetical protein [Nocardioides conyzicola]|uniref:Resolvase/invertase-type recombinase catalytic domain-containing protein n=1 Tax=Nocardioides conyzicola TaxID=1651781 RepID=A0ABP8XF81_9ACTN